MKRTILSLLLIAAPAAALASSADLSLSGFISPPVLQAGEPATLNLHVVNNGPDSAQGVTVSISETFSTSISAPGWTCTSISGIRCSRESFPPGASDLSFGLLPQVAQNSTITAAVVSETNDPFPGDTTAVIPFTVSGSGFANITIADSHSPAAIAVGGAVTITSTITNGGPSGVRDLWIQDVYFPGPFVISDVAAGWTCNVTEESAVRCHGAGIPGGATATLSYTISTQHAGLLWRNTRLRYGGAAAVPTWHDDAYDMITIGLPSDFERILVPVMIRPTPGGYGSVWETKLVAFADGSQVLLFPQLYVCITSPCPPIPPFGEPLPARTVVEPFLSDLAPDPNPARFVYTEKSTSPLLHLNLRVQDLSRQLQTWGTEIPLVRESKARSGRIELLDLPLDSHFRQTVRFYDFDARGDGQLVVRLFGGDTTGRETKIAEVMLTLVIPADNSATTPLQLPERPGYAQLDNLVQRFPDLAAYPKVRIEIEPVTPGLRYWAFASITNNETQHVTTVTPR